MKILFLTGPYEVLQSYFVKDLSLKYNFFKFDINVLCVKKTSFLNHSKLLKKELNTSLLCELLLQEFIKEYDGKENILIVGITKIEEIEYIVSYYEPETYEVLYLDADINLLKLNYERKDKVKIKNDIFLKQLDEEEEKGLNYLKRLSINNVYNFGYYKKNKNNEDIQIRIFENNSKRKKLTFEKK